MAKAVPPVAEYLVGRQRRGFGLFAGQNGEIIGAAWARRFSAEVWGDEKVPKVSIGVKPKRAATAVASGLAASSGKSGYVSSADQGA
jgi:hypothetical protein